MVSTEQARKLMKARLNRLESDTSLDGLFEEIIRASAEEIEKTGIKLQDTSQDMMLVVDTAVWRYQSRDSQAGMPDWLRLRRRERWLNERRNADGEPETAEDTDADSAGDGSESTGTAGSDGTDNGTENGSAGDGSEITGTAGSAGMDGGNGTAEEAGT